MKYTILLLLSVSASAMRLNKKFAVGANGDDDLSEDIKSYK